MIKNKKKVAAFVIIIILAVIPFGLGKYFEFNSPGPYDSGAYVYSARHILEGARIGVEEKPSAALGTLLVNAYQVNMVLLALMVLIALVPIIVVYGGI